MASWISGDFSYSVVGAAHVGPTTFETLALNTNKIFPVGRSGDFLLVKASKRSQGL